MGLVGVWIVSGSGLGGQCLVLGWCRESCGYTHTVLFHLSQPSLHTTPSLPQPTPDRIHTARHTPSHHLAQTYTHHTYPTSIPPNSTPAPTLLQLTRPDCRPIHNPPYTIPPRDTPYPLPTRTTPAPTPQLNPSIPPYPLRMVSMSWCKIFQNWFGCRHS